jgi:hypothetical protein
MDEKPSPVPIWALSHCASTWILGYSAAVGALPQVIAVDTVRAFHFGVNYLVEVCRTHRCCCHPPTQAHTHMHAHARHAHMRKPTHAHTLTLMRLLALVVSVCLSFWF